MANWGTPQFFTPIFRLARSSRNANLRSFVCLFVCLFVLSFVQSSSFSLRSVSEWSQVNPRSVPGQSQVSPRSVPGLSQVSPQGLDKALDWKKVCAVSLLVYFRLWLSEEVWAWERAERRLRERKERNKRTAWIYRGQKDRAKKCERWCYKLFNTNDPPAGVFWWNCPSLFTFSCFHYTSIVFLFLAIYF